MRENDGKKAETHRFLREDTEEAVQTVFSNTVWEYSLLILLKIRHS